MCSCVVKEVISFWELSKLISAVHKRIHAQAIAPGGRKHLLETANKIAVLTTRHCKCYITTFKK